MFAWLSFLEPRDMFYKVSDLSLWFGHSPVVPFVAVAVTEQTSLVQPVFNQDFKHKSRNLT
jgi:hypothetical protein